MTVRNFNNVTTVGTLTGPVASSATTLGVQNFSNLPTAPFTITVDRNTPTEEICLVTAVAGGTLTVTRGYDGSAAVAHSAGAAVEHTAGAIEYIEANAHVNATANVHGVSGGLVGTDGAQSLFAKTLVSPVVQADPVAGDAVVAWVPPAASTRNLFRGMNTAGADVVTVDASGNATVHNMHTTGTDQVDGLLTAAGGVTVPAGKTVAANGGITTTTVNATGNSTIGGNETVTGGITGGSVTALGPLVLGQASSDVAGIAGLSTVYAKTDGGIYRRVGTGVVARVPIHFGSGTTYPTTAFNGDTFFHTGLGCTMLWNGTAFRQTETPIVADATARGAITTSALYAGFRVRQTDTGNTLEWDGTRWFKVGGKPELIAAIDNGNPSGIVNPGTGYQGAVSINIPAHTAGTLRVRWHGSVLSGTNAACFTQLYINTNSGISGGTVIPGSQGRVHNNGNGGAPMFPESEGYWTSDGSSKFAVLGISADPAGGSIQVFMNNWKVWLL